MATYVDALVKAIEQGRPVKFYDDFVCNRCGELWDVKSTLYGVDMSQVEKDRFLQGKGCPSCKGKKSEIVLQLEKELLRR